MLLSVPATIVKQHAVAGIVSRLLTNLIARFSKTMFVQNPHRQIGSHGDNARGRRYFGTRTERVLALAAFLPALLFVSGCKSEVRVPVFPVAGKVTYKGQPTVGAQVVLHAVKAEDTHDVAPTGVVGNDGSFTITVYEPGDGAPQGDYVATIQWRKFVDGGAGPNVLPKEYSSPATSPVKVSVQSGPTNIPPIAIK
jgi:hypothetical protein